MAAIGAYSVNDPIGAYDPGAAIVDIELVMAASEQTQETINLDLLIEGQLVMQSSESDQEASAVVLFVEANLFLADSEQTQEITSVILRQNYPLIIDSTLQLQSAENTAINFAKGLMSINIILR